MALHAIDIQAGWGSIAFGASEAPRRRRDRSGPRAEKRRMNEKTPARRVLLAEDFHDAAEMYASYLQFHGYEVITVADGKTALDTARSQTFDIVVLDVRMPEMTGIDVVRLLKADPAYATVPVVALTAHALQHEREAALQAGFNAFLSKPVLPSNLLATVEALIDSSIPS
jgi:CheY-like chemotaxis protein